MYSSTVLGPVPRLHAVFEIEPVVCLTVMFVPLVSGVRP